MSRRRLFEVLVAAIVTLCLLVFTGTSSAQGNSDEAFERVKEVQERHTDELMAKPGVVGTAVGEGQGAQPIVLVLVEHGEVPGVPQQLEGVPVRPLVTGKIYALPRGGKPGGGGGSTLSPTDKWPRPVPIGVSTGHPAITAGTIGCRVKDAAGNVYALSNNHVYANQNDAVIGDFVLQPGAWDGGTILGDQIGTLADFEFINFYNTASPPAVIPVNTMDAAIALSSVDWLGNATPPDGYGTPKSATATVSFGAKVMKYGRTTRQTSGMVQGTNLTVTVWYDELGTKVARFTGQIVIGGGSFSGGGDSGSLIVLSAKGANNRKPVGLLFAGSSSYTIANPINTVLERFDVTVDGE